jgi:hypothetical protein
LYDYIFVLIHEQWQNRSLNRCHGLESKVFEGILTIFTVRVCEGMIEVSKDGLLDENKTAAHINGDRVVGHPPPDAVSTSDMAAIGLWNRDFEVEAS